jgi:hypothetical protein
MFDTESPLRWRADGFRYLVTPGPRRNVPLRTLAFSYLLCLPALVGAILDPAFAPALLTFLLPLPAALLSVAIEPKPTVVDVDHRRILIEGPFGRRRTIPLRAIRDVSVLSDGLEFLLQAGERLRVNAPAASPTLWWLAERIAEMRAEVSRFEADLGDSRAELARVMSVARAMRSE